MKPLKAAQYNTSTNRIGDLLFSTDRNGYSHRIDIEFRGRGTMRPDTLCIRQQDWRFW